MQHNIGPLTSKLFIMSFRQWDNHWPEFPPLNTLSPTSPSAVCHNASEYIKTCYDHLLDSRCEISSTYSKYPSGLPRPSPLHTFSINSLMSNISSSLSILTHILYIIHIPAQHIWQPVSISTTIPQLNLLTHKHTTPSELLRGSCA